MKDCRGDHDVATAIQDEYAIYLAIEDLRRHCWCQLVPPGWSESELDRFGSDARNFVAFGLRWPLLKKLPSTTRLEGQTHAWLPTHHFNHTRR